VVWAVVKALPRGGSLVERREVHDQLYVGQDEAWSMLGVVRPENEASRGDFDSRAVVKGVVTQETSVEPV
jgi:hypothetical protein